MSTDERQPESASGASGAPSDAAGLPAHPVRAALLSLLRETGTLTSTEAARRLGQSSGVCSFHLRRLAAAGLVEAVPNARGRSKPWRLAVPSQAGPGPGEEFGALARGLEDESWRSWQDAREAVPARWRREEAFSAVVYLAPEELAEVAEAVREVLAKYRDREWRPSARPPGAGPVAAVTRIYPLVQGPEPGPHAE